LSEATADDDFEDLFETAPCGYLSVSPGGRIIRGNRTLAAWLGVKPQYLAGSPLTDLLPIPGRIYFETHLKPALGLHGFVNEVALDLLTPEGARLPVIANLLARNDDAGAHQFTRIAVFLATERRRYERNLLQARDAAQAEGRQLREDSKETRTALTRELEGADLRDQFIAVLGHDLRNPLAALTGGLALLRKEQPTARALAVNAMMQDTVGRMSGLIDNILDFARGRLGGGIPLALDNAVLVGPILEQVAEELRTARPDRLIALDLEMPDPVRCDVLRIGQLVSNLLGNALTHGAPDSTVKLMGRTNGDRLEIAVSNSGDQIPESAMARLFQPFFRGEVRQSMQGLGLGLHIASEIAKAHAGEMGVASDSDETRFTFRMPIRD